MKYSIYKYEVEPDFLVQSISMPAGANILSFGVDGNDRLCMWAQVDSEAPIEQRRIACVGTGWDITNLYKGTVVKFIGTVTHGYYVWHLFDLGTVEDRNAGIFTREQKNEVIKDKEIKDEKT